SRPSERKRLRHSALQPRSRPKLLRARRYDFRRALAPVFAGVGRELDEGRAATFCLQGPVSIGTVSGRKSSRGCFDAGPAGKHDDRLRRRGVSLDSEGERQRSEVARRAGRSAEATRRWIHHDRDRGRPKADRARRETSRRGGGRVETELRTAGLAKAGVIVVATALCRRKNARQQIKRVNA